MTLSYRVVNINRIQITSHTFKPLYKGENRVITTNKQPKTLNNE